MRDQNNTTNVRSFKQCRYCTLWIKRPSHIKTHNVITDNCKKIRREYHCPIWLVNECFKCCSYCKNAVRIKTSALNDHCPPWHKLKDGDATDAQLQQWWHDTASLAVCSSRVAYSTGFRSGEFGGHTSDEMNFGVSLSRNTMVAQAFWWRQLTSSLPCVVQVS